MFLFIGLALCCFIVTVHPQGAYYPAYQNPESIYFPGASNAVPLSLSQESQQPQPNQEILQQIFGRPPRNNNAVEIERSKELLATTSIEQVTNRPNSGSRAPTSSNREVPSKGPNGQSQVAPIRPLQAQPVVPNPAGYNGHLYSVTNFGINLIKNVNALQSGNAVVSPYSITAILALLQQGSAGQTLEQLNAALRMTPSVSAAAYSALSADFRGRSSRNVLRTGNGVFVGDNFDLNSQFKSIAQGNFGSDVMPVNFAESEKAASQINRWVSLRTNNKIERLVSPESFDFSTQIVLVNAIYFKGLWSIPFNPNATRLREFYLSNGQSKSSPFMRMRRRIKAGTDTTTNAQVVVLPFDNEEYSMMIILPSPHNGIRGTLDTISDARLLSYLSFPVMDTELELPKFTARADTDLVNVLSRMGITQMFSPYAELSGLGNYRTLSPQISSAVHSAVLSIDEFGASAAAASSFAGVALSYDEPAISVNVNRPFIAVLWDTTSSLPLFMAKIENPEV